MHKNLAQTYGQPGLKATQAAQAKPHCPKKENRLSSGCDPMVVAEHSAEALSALNRVMG